MKCEYCGSNLGIEDELCPHCGKPNSHAKQHSEAMRAFTARFRNTETEVRENTRRFNRFTVSLTVLAILVALNAIMLLLIANEWELEDFITERHIRRNMDMYSSNIDRMIEEKDYRGLDYYSRANKIAYSTALEQYDVVFSVSRSYGNMLDGIIGLFVNDRSKSYNTVNDGEIIENIARYYDNLCGEADYLERTWGEPYPEHVKEFVYNAIEDGGMLLKEFFGITDEELRLMGDMTLSRITVLLEEGYSR